MNVAQIWVSLLPKAPNMRSLVSHAPLLVRYQDHTLYHFLGCAKRA